MSKVKKSPVPTDVELAAELQLASVMTMVGMDAHSGPAAAALRELLWLRGRLRALFIDHDDEAAAALAEYLASIGGSRCCQALEPGS